jgi:hypothetical protein
MGIKRVKRIIKEYKDYSGWWDYPRRGKDLSILKIKERGLSLIP